MTGVPTSLTTTVTHVTTVTTVEAPAPLTVRAVDDVSHLPDIDFGPRDLMWWGTAGFMVIEGFTLALCAAVLLYLWKNYDAWPPIGTPLPSLVAPSIQMALMLASLPVVAWLGRAAKRFALGEVRLTLTILSFLNVAFVLLRVWELLRSLNVKWDTNAYGSAQWLVLGAHGTLLIVEAVEIAGMALIFWIAPAERKHFSDAADVGFYWYFMVLAWIPLYLLCFWLPRWY